MMRSIPQHEIVLNSTACMHQNWVHALEPSPKSLKGSGSCGQVSLVTTRKQCRLTQVMAEEEGQTLSLVCHYFQPTRIIIHVENQRPSPWSSCTWGNTNFALDDTNPDFCWPLMQRNLRFERPKEKWVRGDCCWQVRTSPELFIFSASSGTVPTKSRIKDFRIQVSSRTMAES